MRITGQTFHSFYTHCWEHKLSRPVAAGLNSVQIMQGTVRKGTHAVDTRSSCGTQSGDKAEELALLVYIHVPRGTAAHLLNLAALKRSEKRGAHNFG